MKIQSIFKLSILLLMLIGMNFGASLYNVNSNNNNESLNNDSFNVYEFTESSALNINNISFQTQLINQSELNQTQIAYNRINNMFNKYVDMMIYNMYEGVKLCIEIGYNAQHKYLNTNVAIIIQGITFTIIIVMLIYPITIIVVILYEIFKKIKLKIKRKG